MHYEILVEDQSGENALQCIVPRIIGSDNTFRIRSYKGIGKIPPNMKSATEASKRILLDQLPRLLKGYGKQYAATPGEYAVFVVCDLDDKCLKSFRAELLAVLDGCNPRPNAHFCIAIEEGEAWLLGDIQAVKAAYPKAKDNVLKGYQNDSICNTWEVLADAVYTGGAPALTKKGWQVVGKKKSEWAEKIAPNIDIEHNKSESFKYFVRKMQELLQ